MASVRQRIQVIVTTSLAALGVAGCATSTSDRHSHTHHRETAGLAHQAAPGQYRLLLEDEVVRLIEFTLDPGERDEWHRHPHEAFYVLEGGTIRIELPDGEAIEATFEAGDVTSHGPWTHRVENIGETRFRAIIFEVVSSE